MQSLTHFAVRGLHFALTGLHFALTGLCSEPRCDYIRCGTAYTNGRVSDYGRRGTVNGTSTHPRDAMSISHRAVCVMASILVVAESSSQEDECHDT